LLASAHKDGTVRLWDPATGKERLRLPGHTDEPHALCFSRDGTVLISGAHDGTIRFRDAATGRELRRVTRPQERVQSLALSPDGRVLASGGSWRIRSGLDADGRLLLWDAATGRLLRELRGHRRRVESVAFAPDGKTLASGDYRSIRLWDAGD